MTPTRPPMTREEALQESRRRWGETALVDDWRNVGGMAFVASSFPIRAGEWGNGSSWEAAFADATRRESSQQGGKG